MEKRRVAITGIGICAPLGIGREIFWRRLINGETSIRDISHDSDLYSTDESKRIAQLIATSKAKVGSYFLPEQLTDESLRLRAEDLGYDLTDKEQASKYRILFKSGEHFARISFSSGREAIEDSRILHADDIEYIKRRTGCAIAAGFGALSAIESASMRIEKTKTIDKVKPALLARTALSSTAASTLSEYFGFHEGNAPSLETACTSGLIVVTYGFDKIKYRGAVGHLDGGTGDLSLLTLGGFDTLGAISRNPDPNTASRPYDKNRDGFVLGDGAAVLYLEELSHAVKRGAHIYAEILGYGETQDAGHPTQPDENGEFASQAIIHAIEDSGINPLDIVKS